MLLYKYSFYYQGVVKSHQLGGFLEMPLGIASYQLKEIIDNTIAEFEKNKLKTL
ncbi:hypothetical protein [Capnocytophaga sputigena]|uniref:hypothetical protein n=1 Tax=Capnocytophaga sputigena TaxID=1019 RepID=UPI0012FF9E68|nr:hypothetical protein [Capnocytophaga sputigena]